jgi:hypothetical protein
VPPETFSARFFAAPVVDAPFVFGEPPFDFGEPGSS